jgi:hypothetical protein
MEETKRRTNKVPGAAATWPRLESPIVVLTCGRSGSTLLRFLLDAHPALACPPETGLIDLSMRMSVLSRLLDGRQSGARQGLSSLGIVSIRSWVSVTFGAYLTKVGKRRWCDKSLGSADSADKFLEIFPETKFICLYRNCMDVVDSVIEACPFGLRGYGLEPFAGSHPGNSIAAIADYWASHTRSILRFEKAHPECCFRLRYEDFVADPEGVASGLFDFLDEEQVPGISAACLREDKDIFGPADHKIYMTSEITDSSVGRGRRLPYKMINPPMTAVINGLLDELGYPVLAEGWESQPSVVKAESEAEARVSASPMRLALEKLNTAGGLNISSLEDLLAQRVSAWSIPEAEDPGTSCLSVAVTVAGAGPEHIACRWDLDLTARSFSRADLATPMTAPTATTGWTFGGALDAFDSVLSGRVNLATAIRNGQLRIDERHSDAELAGIPQPAVSRALHQGEPRIRILRELFRPQQALAVAATSPGS